MREQPQIVYVRRGVFESLVSFLGFLVVLVPLGVLGAIALYALILLQLGKFRW